MALFVLFTVLNNYSISINRRLSIEKKLKSATALCIWDGAAVRSIHSRTGKWLSSLTLGEKVEWLNQTAKDSLNEDDKHCKIRLSDGKEGWVLDYEILTKAIPAAIINKSEIYERIKIFKDKGIEFLPMDFVAITEVKDNWIKVVGNQKQKEGWIQSEVVSLKEDDVTVTVKVSLALQEKDEKSKGKKLQKIMSDSTISNSPLIKEVKKLLKKIEQPAPIPSDTSTAIPPEQKPDIDFIITLDNSNLKEQNSSVSPIIALVEKGTILHEIENQGEWKKVRMVKSISGWVHKNTVNGNRSSLTLITKRNTNVREENKSNSKILTTVI